MQIKPFKDIPVESDILISFYFILFFLILCILLYCSFNLETEKYLIQFFQFERE